MQKKKNHKLFFLNVLSFFVLFCFYFVFAFLKRAWKTFGLRDQEPKKGKAGCCFIIHLFFKRSHGGLKRRRNRKAGWTTRKKPLLQKILWLQQGQESESSTVPWGVGQRRWLGILDTSLNFSLVGLRELFDGVRGRGGRNGRHLPWVEENKLRQPVQWLPWETFQHTLLLIACIWIAHLVNCLIYSSRHLSLSHARFIIPVSHHQSTFW